MAGGYSSENLNSLTGDSYLYTEGSGWAGVGAV